MRCTVAEIDQRLHIAIREHPVIGRARMAHVAGNDGVTPRERFFELRAINYAARTAAAIVHEPTVPLGCWHPQFKIDAWRNNAVNLTYLWNTVMGRNDLRLHDRCRRFGKLRKRLFKGTFAAAAGCIGGKGLALLGADRWRHGDSWP